ncbi:50S ribosomal protein L25 [Candidatus Nomurabacteria bacterium CG_4_9_14_0_2_um_filter_32_10]|uniref:Large ribosomal subunit protein bL25 n=2 Tax=Candidatus Nomuraibacteriota TaxID=1752729 RepID=A0A2J0MPI6_9BACT|nr:MAG: 50S ribosomal protein L25 [Candidatus Nomurabacteria bacterium CG_4_10_14_0_2_um_filter_33_9]PJC49157.1 MAG: 50S ribosomal protein L25 [Candidatus Nomurabacteria bacterium CG_4_9_14_0_2_um_filter_32_10]
MFVIKAKKRNEGVNLDTLRKIGEIPAVFYGTGKVTTSISISIIEFKKIWREAGESSTVKISIDDNNIDVLIHEVQVNPVTEEPIHVDFLVVDMNKKIKINVPLEFIGISNAVKNGLGNLVKILHEIEIEALPKDLPHNLEVDISKLETIEDQIFISDIKLPIGVAVISNEQDVIASIVLQVEEKEEVAPPVDLSSIEVEKKGKKEEEAPTPEGVGVPASDDSQNVGREKK